MASAAHYLKTHCGGMENVLVMNLGDPWTDPTQLRLFDHRVVDFPSSGKNVAPGSDLIPLDILFTICSSMHSWLRINDKNVTVSHISLLSDTQHISGICYTVSSCKQSSCWVWRGGLEVCCWLLSSISWRFGEDFIPASFFTSAYGIGCSLER